MEKLKKLLYKILFKSGFISPAFYINGPETLPPPLSQEEENRLLNENTEQSRNILIVHNLRLVVYIARKFDNVSTGIEDLILDWDAKTGVVEVKTAGYEKIFTANTITDSNKFEVK